MVCNHLGETNKKQLYYSVSAYLYMYSILSYFIIQVAMACSVPTVEDIISKAGVKDRLHKLCSEQDIEKIIEYCKQWKRIGRYLGLTATQIEDIDKEMKTEHEKRSTMLAMWKQIFSFKATFEKLVKAIYDCGCTDDAYQVCLHLSTKARDDIRESSTRYLSNMYPSFLHILTDEKKAVPAEPALPNRDINYMHFNRIQPNGSSGDYSERLSRNLRDRSTRITKEHLEAKFSELTDEFEKSVSSVQLADIRKIAASLPHSVRQYLKDSSNAVRCMIRAESMVKFLGEFNTHSCYLCPSPLQHMVTKYGSEKCRQMMAEYQQNLLRYRQTTTIKQHINKQGETGPMHREFVEMLGSNWEEKTVEDFVQHCNRQQLCDSLLRLSC
jgi:hypothetical protein